MKLFNITLNAALVIALAACAFTKEEPVQMGPLSVSNAKPMAGSTIDLKYKGNASIDEAILYYTVKDKIYLADIEPTKNDSLFEATILVPDSATSLAFHFFHENEIDEPRPYGYSLPVYAKDGKPVAGAYFGQTNYLNLQAARYDFKFEKDSVLKLIEADMTANPTEADYMKFAHARALMDVDKEQGQAEMEKILAELNAKPELNLEDYTSMNSIYRSLRNREMSDSISKIAAEKFPLSYFGETQMYYKFYEQTDDAGKELVLKEFAAKFPESDLVNYMVYGLAISKIKESDFQNFDEYVAVAGIDYKMILYSEAIKNLTGNADQIEKAEAYYEDAKSALKEYVASHKINPLEETKNMVRRTASSLGESLKASKAEILFAKGDYKGAIENISEYAQKSRNPGSKETYLKYLIADKQYDVAQDFATELMVKLEVNPQIESYLEEAYKNNDNEISYADFIADLDKKATTEMMNEMEKKMVDEEINDFTIKDENGRSVTLSDLKGKVVVLDFWANWCGPCKASFPGMQMAQDKLKDDPNVLFLFVNTFERTSLDQRVSTTNKLMEDNNYRFKVLYDEMKDDGSGEFIVAPSYGITGIPTKLIVGADGRLKFRSVGYGGNDKKLVKEMEAMTQLAKI